MFNLLDLGKIAGYSIAGVAMLFAVMIFYTLYMLARDHYSKKK